MRQRQPAGGHKPSAQRRAAERLYALLLLLYPPAHRRAYGPLMLQTFRDSCRDARATHGHLGPLFWLSVAGDEVKSLGREHATALRAEALRLRRWGGELAAGGVVLGGVAIYIARCVH